MLVAALIVVRPSIEVKAIKCHPLRAVSAGRTSRWKRFLSIPKYRGASRNRMNRGATAFREGSASWPMRAIFPAEKRSSQCGNCSLTLGEGLTRCEAVSEAGVAGKDSSGFINDHHVWFRSFRVKSSRMSK